MLQEINNINEELLLECPHCKECIIIEKPFKIILKENKYIVEICDYI